MSASSARQWVHTLALALLAVAATAAAGHLWITPSYADDSAASPGVICATPLEANDGKVPAFNITKYKDAYQRWMNTQLGTGRTHFVGATTESLYMVCAW